MYTIFIYYIQKKQKQSNKHTTKEKNEGVYCGLLKYKYNYIST